MGNTKALYKVAEAQCNGVPSIRLTSSTSKLAFLPRLGNVTNRLAGLCSKADVVLLLSMNMRYASSNTGVSLQAANVESPVQDSLESSFFGSSAARHMLKPGGGALYPALSSNKPLVLPNTGWPPTVTLLGVVLG